MPKILLTRPLKSSQKIAKNLAHKNISSLVQPLFSIIQVKNLQPETRFLQAVLITSSAAVFALKKLAINLNILILTVGEKTAAAAKKLGYKNVLAANNSAALLLDLALEKLSANQGLVLYLSGEIITLDLAKELNEKDFLAEKIVVYKTVEKENFSIKTISEIQSGNIAEVWLYSKNSAKIFYKLAGKHNLLECLKELKILNFFSNPIEIKS